MVVRVRVLEFRMEYKYVAYPQMLKRQWLEADPSFYFYFKLKILKTN